ncbi:MAG: iron ABC transporter permease [Anaerolineales bacterium]|nr:iron ABC transporter permease [Anaerolineales bacterium]
MGESLTPLHRLLVSAGYRPRIAAGPPRRLPILWLAGFIIALLLLLPVAYLLIRVLQADATTWTLIRSASTRATVLRTVALAGSVTAASILVAVPLAWLTVRTDLPLKRMWALLTALPMVIPSYVGAYLIVASLGPRGILAQIAEEVFGVRALPSIYGFPGALYVLTLLSFPYILLTVRAALQGIDPALEESSRSLGNGPWRTFWQVTLPQLRPAIASGSLLVALYVLRDFGAVSIMRYNTFTRVIYVQYKSAFDRASAAGLAIILVLLTLALLIAEVRTRSRASFERSATGGIRKASSVRLGRWRWPALLFCTGIVTISLIIPLSVLLYWLVRGLIAGETLQPLWQATGNSVFASAITAIVALLAAIPAVVLSVRRAGRWNQLPERLTYTAYALPGIVVALALVFFGANFAPALYQTLLMLILAYLILFLPQAVGSLQASLLQVPASLEEAARSMGRRPWTAFWQITFPLLRPGALAGMALVFLTTMKELPATLILSPYNFSTLATRVWSAVSEAFFAQAAAPALLLILTSSLPMAVILFRERA